MAQEDKETELTEQGGLVVALSKALFADDIDATFRILGEHMDKHGLKVSKIVLDEYRNAGRVAEADINLL